MYSKEGVKKLLEKLGETAYGNPTVFFATNNGQNYRDSQGREIRFLGFILAYGEANDPDLKIFTWYNYTRVWESFNTNKRILRVCGYNVSGLNL